MKSKKLWALMTAGFFAAASIQLCAEEESGMSRENVWGRQGKNGKENSNREGREEKMIEMLKSKLQVSDQDAKKLVGILKAQRKQHQAFRKKLESILSKEQMNKLKGVMKSIRSKHKERRENRKSEGNERNGRNDEE